MSSDKLAACQFGGRRAPAFERHRCFCSDARSGTNDELRTKCPSQRTEVHVGKVIWHVTTSVDGFIAGPEHSMVDGIYGGRWTGPVFVLTHRPQEALDDPKGTSSPVASKTRSTRRATPPATGTSRFSGRTSRASAWTRGSSTKSSSTWRRCSWATASASTAPRQRRESTSSAFCPRHRAPWSIYVSASGASGPSLPAETETPRQGRERSPARVRRLAPGASERGLTSGASVGARSVGRRRYRRTR